MRKLLPFFLLSVVLSGIAAWKLDPSRLFAAIQPVVVCLSIMMAAIFVRLNRGMPTLDWKSINVADRKNLTARVVSITLDYLVGLALTATSIVALVIFLGVGPVDLLTLPQYWREGLVGGFILVLLFSLTWMGYVVWRDYDIVRLQRKILDDAADKEEMEKQAKGANEKLLEIKAAGLKPSPTTVKLVP